MVAITPRKLIFNQQFLRYKLIVILISVCGLYIFFTQNQNTFDPRLCFGERNLGEQLEPLKLENILLSKRKPKLSKTIFFHETSCSKDGHLRLNARQACAIESAALMNPKWDVFVLFASPSSLTNSSTNDIIESLMSYRNIYFRNVNLWSYAADTPIYEWLKNGKLFESKYVLSHISDFLRYLTLWRWGGTYLDLDVVVRKSLDNISPNYAGAESDKFVAAGVLNFDSENFGHQIADMCLRNFQIDFNGNEWGHNGPGVITRVLQILCKSKSPKLMTRERCHGFKVFNNNAFYAVRWWDWKHFFQESKLNATLDLVKDSILIHVWNKHSKNELIKVGSKVAYGVIAEKYCPKVYKAAGAYF